MPSTKNELALLPVDNSETYMHACMHASMHTDTFCSGPCRSCDHPQLVNIPVASRRKDPIRWASKTTQERAREVHRQPINTNVAVRAAPRKACSANTHSAMDHASSFKLLSRCTAEEQMNRWVAPTARPNSRRQAGRQAGGTSSSSPCLERFAAFTRPARSKMTASVLSGGHA